MERILQFSLFWDGTACSSAVWYRRFGGTTYWLRVKVIRDNLVLHGMGIVLLNWCCEGREVAELRFRMQSDSEGWETLN